MIAIKLALEQTAETASLFRNWSECIREAGLFGRVLVSEWPTNCLGDLLAALTNVAGSMDVAVAAAELDANQGAEVLNAGAQWLIVPGSDLSMWETTVPSNRLLVQGALRGPGSPDSVAAPERFWWWVNDDAPIGDCWRRLAEATTVFCRPAVFMHLARENSGRRIAVFGDHTLRAAPESVAIWYHAALRSDRPDHLIPTLVTDESGIALGLAYSNEQSLIQAVSQRAGVYWSRSRQALWIKGESSGAHQLLRRIDVDCDSDCLRFVVQQQGAGFCHRGTYSCFGDERNLATVFRRIRDSIGGSDVHSYSRRIATNSELLAEKLVEEARELAAANEEADVTWEVADVLYFAFVAAARAGVDLAAITSELARRMQRVVRRD